MRGRRRFRVAVLVAAFVVAACAWPGTTASPSARSPPTSAIAGPAPSGVSVLGGALLETGRAAAELELGLRENADPSYMCDGTLYSRLDPQGLEVLREGHHVVVSRLLVFFRSPAPPGATCEDQGRPGVKFTECETQVVGGLSALPGGSAGWDGVFVRTVPPWQPRQVPVPLATIARGGRHGVLVPLRDAFDQLESACAMKLLTAEDIAKAPLDARGQELAATYHRSGLDDAMPLEKVCAAARAASGPWTVELVGLAALVQSKQSVLEVMVDTRVERGHLCVAGARGRVPEF